MAAAGCGTASNGCNCCCSAVVAPTETAVWVAQGTRLLRLDPSTGEIVWTRQVTRRTPSGSEELTAVSASPEGVWVAWHSGAALIGEPRTRARRLAILPRAAFPTLATLQGRTWLGAGRRVMALRSDGGIARTVRFGGSVRIAAGGDDVLVVRTGRSTVLLDPRTGSRRDGAIVGRRSGWRADYRAQEVSRLDPATGARRESPIRIEGLGGVVEGPDESAYAVSTNLQLGVARLDPDGPRVLWRTRIAPG